VKTDWNHSPDFTAHLPASSDVNQNTRQWMNIINRLPLSGFLIKSLGPKQKLIRISLLILLHICQQAFLVSKHLPASIDVNPEYIRIMILSGFLTKSLKPKVKTDWNHSPDFTAHPPASFSVV
jgi:hypothetical protein